MTLAQLNAKIDALPPRPVGLFTPQPKLDREDARYLRDERLGILGVYAGQEPTEEQVDLVNAQLFGEPAQRGLL